MAVREICGRLAVPTEEAPELSHLASYLAGFGEAQERCLQILAHPLAGYSAEFTRLLIAECEVDAKLALELLDSLQGAGAMGVCNGR